MWHRLNTLQWNGTQFQDDRDLAILNIHQCHAHMRQLMSANVLNLSLYIGHDGCFGTINRFRLGTLPPRVIVEWNEVNAAWGEATLLLQHLASLLNFRFSRYCLLPLGSRSKILCQDSTAVVYHVFHGVQLEQYSESRFNRGMSAWLDCLDQLGMYLVESKDTSIRLPYVIRGKTINELSIELLPQGEERWTKALKFALTNLKWILAWVHKTRVKGRA